MMKQSLAALALGLALSTLASAQDYPNRPVRLIVTFPAGGGADFVARTIGPKIAEGLGQPVTIENRAGAGGLVGNDYVAKSPADGYTLLLAAAGPTTIAPHLYEKVAFDTLKDFAAIAQVASAPFVVTVHPSVKASSLAELTALAKANPGKLNFGSSGNGGAPHLATELYKTMAGVNMVHVPYKGLAPAITDLLGGQIQVLFADVGLVLAHVKAGKIRALAATSAQRSSAMPDVPTVAESGLPGYSAGTWYGILAPAGTPPAIVSRVHAEIQKGLAVPEVKAQFAKQGLETASTTPDQFAAIIREDFGKWAKVVKDTGAKAE